MNSNEIRMTVIQSPFPGLKRLPLLFIVGLNVLLGCSSITLQVLVVDSYQQGVWTGVFTIFSAVIYAIAAFRIARPTLQAAMAMSVFTCLIALAALGFSIYILVISDSLPYIALYDWKWNILISQLIVNGLEFLVNLLAAIILIGGLHSQPAFAMQNQQIVYTTQQQYSNMHQYPQPQVITRLA